MDLERLDNDMKREKVGRLMFGLTKLTGRFPRLSVNTQYLITNNTIILMQVALMVESRQATKVMLNGNN